MTRMREYLNAQRSMHSVTPSVIVGSELDDRDDDMQHIDEDGNAGSQLSLLQHLRGTPIVNVTSTHPPGSTPIAGPAWDRWSIPHGLAALSQSAPASTGGAHWAGGHLAVQASIPQTGTNHVTGMMGATALDDVDEEGDDAFGDESELMGD